MNKTPKPASMSKKINLREVSVQTIDGSVQKIDFSEAIANAVYFSAKDIAVAEAARELYKSGECDYSDAMAEAVRGVVERNYGIVVSTAITGVLK